MIDIHELSDAVAKQLAPIYSVPLKQLKKQMKKPEDNIMRKSITIALILAAVAGALVTIYFYLARRERELNEYEEILFSDDLGDLPANDFADTADQE